MPFGLGPWGWFIFPYLFGGYGYTYTPYYTYWAYSWFPWDWWWRCRWFPWLPRWWWTGIYGPITPWSFPGAPTLTREDEIAMLEEQAKALERELEDTRRRLEELKK
ncbi:MAG: hypothetical protein DRO36_00065 [Candidatus Hecatellales archaeon]|nr:MAG: hypothetical protein DRO36_00065 [Candidatus Hecatellales archaeon]